MSQYKAHLETADGYFERDVLENVEAVDLGLQEHGRMRRIGMHVVPYEVISIEGGVRLRAERIEGIELDDMPDQDFRREAGKLATGWHRYFTDVHEQQVRYILGPDLDTNQFMHGITVSEAVPRTYLVDIDPILVDTQAVAEDPNGKQALLFASSLRALSWMQQYWSEAEQTDFPYSIPTEAELDRIAALHR